MKGLSYKELSNLSMKNATVKKQHKFCHKQEVTGHVVAIQITFPGKNLRIWE